ncbi:hypothetical protein [uncultured Erythrobacter sp.]|uniref:hypothetical protein n=1 Tax=uncultured Erythrobacter sp. TaxID=263913 RepID=UPI00261BA24E|nr:hypothetical protein [uncultured Erythrobacter sp.]
MHKMTNRIMKLAILSGALAATQAQASVSKICLELPTGSKTLSAEIASGCLPTSPRHEGKFTLEVDQANAMIQIDGEFSQIGDQRIGTADCMGSQRLTLNAEAVEPRRYSIIFNGQYKGVFDVSDGAGQSGCIGQHGSVRGEADIEVLRRSTFEGWVAAELGELAELTAPSMGELVGQLLGNHPESMEGRGVADVRIGKARWQQRMEFKPGPGPGGRGAAPFVAVRIEEHGYLDDSVSGRRVFAVVRQTQEGGWTVTEQWQQWMCARGGRSGQWSGEPCV